MRLASHTGLSGNEPLLILSLSYHPTLLEHKYEVFIHFLDYKSVVYVHFLDPKCVLYVHFLDPKCVLYVHFLDHRDVNHLTESEFFRTLSCRAMRIFLSHPSESV